MVTVWSVIKAIKLSEHKMADVEPGRRTNMPNEFDWYQRDETPKMRIAKLAAGSTFFV